MNCPKCNGTLKTKSHKGIEVDYCSNCKGMWLDLDELDQLEDKTFDEDDSKGTMIFSCVESEHHCPHCSVALRRFRYRLYDLELEYCENKHGFWLDEGEEKRVQELMKDRKKQMQRKGSAEADWARTLHQLKSKSFLGKVKGLFK